MVGVTAFVVLMESSQRRIPVQYAKRVVGRRMYGGQSTHLPIRVNTAGVIPVIFASSIIMFPQTITQFVTHPWAQAVTNALSWGHPMYTVLYATAIIFFCYFYTAIIFNPVDVADNMRKYGGFIPGIRPGRRTAEYIDGILTRLTFIGSLYLTTSNLLLILQSDETRMITQGCKITIVLYHFPQVGSSLDGDFQKIQCFVWLLQQRE